MGRGKLVDDLSSAQFDSLVKVLSLPSTKRDFRHLLTPSNLREVFDHPEEFILPKVPRLNFEGSRNARVRERVQGRLLTRIKEASKEMTGGDLGDEYPFVAPPSRESLSTHLKRLRELETDSISELQQQAASQRPQQARGKAFIPQPREATRTTTTPPKEWQPASQPRGGPPEKRRSPSLSRGRIRIVEGRE